MLGWLYTLFADRSDKPQTWVDDYEFVQHTDTQPTSVDITRALTHKYVCYAAWYTNQALLAVYDVIEHMPAAPPLQGVIN